MNKEYLLPVSILIAGILISGSVIYGIGLKSGPALPGGQEQSPVLDLTEDDVVLGDLNAPVTLVEYSDFQCPFCGRFYSQTETLIRENYVKEGKAKFVYRHLAFLGPESQAAANAVECAKDQGKFWQYHDEIFNAEIADGRENNGNLNKNLFTSIAKSLGMDLAQFNSCLDSGKYSGKVASDYKNAQKIGVQSTPTTFINGTRLDGALPFQQFQLLIDAELSE